MTDDFYWFGEPEYLGEMGIVQDLFETPLKVQEEEGMGVLNLSACLKLGEEGMALEGMVLGLDKIRIDKQRLIEKLRENKTKHTEEYLASQAAWKLAVIAELKEMLIDAEESGEFRLHINLPQPVDHTKAYDRVIKMLEVSADDIVVITSREFQQYYEDEWEWKGAHTELLSNYRPDLAKSPHL